MSVTTARFKRISPSPEDGRPRYRVHCGAVLNRERETLCSGALGVAVGISVSLDGDDTDAELLDDWFMLHDLGYDRDAATGHYRPAQRRRRALNGLPIGRRPLPARLRDPYDGQHGRRGVVGQTVRLPAMIVCQVCNRPNSVSPPMP